MIEKTFRAWDEVGQRWLHGYGEHGMGCSIVGETIFIEGWLTEVNFASSAWNEIIIEQTLGIFDCKEKKIYENDIVKCGLICGYVKFNGVSFMLSRFDDEAGYILSVKDWKESEVIGDMHHINELKVGKYGYEAK